MNNIKSRIKISLDKSKINLQHQYFCLFPTKVDIQSQAFIQKPHQIIDKLRQIAPIHYLPQNKTWLVLNYDDTVSILTNPQRFSSKPFSYHIDKILLGADPPEHTENRGKVQEYFSRQEVLKFEHIAQSHTDLYIQQLPKLNKFFKLRKDLAEPLIHKIIGDFLGIDHQKMYLLTGNIKRDYNSWQKIQPFLTGKGVLSKVIEDKKLTEEKIIALIGLLINAGVFSTKRAMGNIFYQLLQYPEIMNQVRNNNQLIPILIEELLRLESIPVAVPRQNIMEERFGDVIIPPGSLIYVSIAGANRDPQKFINPNELILDRQSPKPLNFGLGIHQCIGRHIAKLQLQIILEAFLTKLPPFKLAQPLKDVEFGGHILERGVEDLILTIDN